MELFKIIELAKKEKQSLIGATIWVNEFDFSVTKQKARANKPFQKGVLISTGDRVEYRLGINKNQTEVVLKRYYNEKSTTKIYFSLTAAIKGYENALERKKKELDDYAKQRKRTIDSYTKKIKDVKKKHGI